MRLTIVHGRDGAIDGIVAYPKDAPPAFPQTRPGQFITEIDAPATLKHGLGQRAIHDQLTNIMRDYVVDVAGKKSSLARRS